MSGAVLPMVLCGPEKTATRGLAEVQRRRALALRIGESNRTAARAWRRHQRVKHEGARGAGEYPPGIRASDLSVQTQHLIIHS